MKINMENYRNKIKLFFIIIEIVFTYIIAAFQAKEKRNRKHRVIIDCTWVYVCKWEDVILNASKENMIYIDLK